MTERYRRLPGARRGILHGASIWIGSGHLLLVRSSRFRDEYKRFYLRDVQAIVVARKPRFHISTRSLVIVLALGCAYPLLRVRWEWVDTAFWTLGGLLIAAWVYVSAACSCTCRLYTAVSRDDLPSVYRTWTARRFLAAVAPAIAEVQGVIEGDWTATVEHRRVGPPLPPLPGRTETAHFANAVSPSEPTPQAATTPLPAAATATRAGLLVTCFFLASLFVDALAKGLILQSGSGAGFWTVYGLTFVEITACIAILIQYQRGGVQRAMQRLAIVSLLAIGTLFYIQQVTAGIRAQETRSSTSEVLTMPAPSLLTWIAIATDATLGVAGLVILARRGAGQ